MAIDDVARFNQARWEDLAQARVAYSRPALELDATGARAMLDREGVLDRLAPTLTGKRALCLAAGGGQQSAAFALLGAEAVVLDFCATQLERDHEAARHHGTEALLTTEQGDMRDLSRFADASFDVVWQAHSLNFVPDAATVLAEVGRVLRPGGVYRLEVTNPFVHGAWEDSWTGRGYAVGAQPYADGEIHYDDARWTVDDGQGQVRQVDGPREFRHTLSTLINGLLGCDLRLLGLWEDTRAEGDPTPGSWHHFKRAVAPWITLWSQRA